MDRTIGDTTISESKKETSGKPPLERTWTLRTHCHVLRTYQLTRPHFNRLWIISSMIWCTRTCSRLHGRHPNLTETEEHHQQVVKWSIEDTSTKQLIPQTGKVCFPYLRGEYLGISSVTIKYEWTHQKPPQYANGPFPNEENELQRFLGFCNFYRRIIPNTLTFAKPLTILTGDIPWKWDDEQQNAFESLINADNLRTRFLALIRPNGQLRIEADASDYAIGAILSQKQDDTWHPIAYLSKSLTETQRIMKFTTRRCLPLCSPWKNGDITLLEQKTFLRSGTDHQNLQYFRQPQKVNRRQARWLTELAQYHFTLLTTSQEQVTSTRLPVEAARSWQGGEW